MKPHIILKLYQQLADEARISNWVDFITDKSVVRQHVDPAIDAMMRDLGLRYWLTREYRPAGRRGARTKSAPG